jgi:hypothetical protein
MTSHLSQYTQDKPSLLIVVKDSLLAPHFPNHDGSITVNDHISSFADTLHNIICNDNANIRIHVAAENEHDGRSAVACLNYGRNDKLTTFTLPLEELNQDRLGATSLVDYVLFVTDDKEKPSQKFKKNVKLVTCHDLNDAAGKVTYAVNKLFDPA